MTSVEGERDGFVTPFHRKNVNIREVQCLFCRLLECYRIYARGHLQEHPLARIPDKCRREAKGLCLSC